MAQGVGERDEHPNKDQQLALRPPPRRLRISPIPRCADCCLILGPGGARETARHRQTAEVAQRLVPALQVQTGLHRRRARSRQLHKSHEEIEARQFKNFLLNELKAVGSDAESRESALQWISLFDYSSTGFVWFKAGGRRCREVVHHVGKEGVQAFFNLLRAG